MIWTTFLGGGAREVALDVDVDAAGDVHVSGSTDSLDFPLVHPAQPAPGGGGTPTPDGQSDNVDGVRRPGPVGRGGVPHIHVPRRQRGRDRARRGRRSRWRHLRRRPDPLVRLSNPQPDPAASRRVRRIRREGARRRGHVRVLDATRRHGDGRRQRHRRGRAGPSLGHRRHGIGGLPDRRSLPGVPQRHRPGGVRNRARGRWEIVAKSSYLGGTGDDRGVGIAVGADAAYVTGRSTHRRDSRGRTRSVARPAIATPSWPRSRRPPARSTTPRISAARHRTPVTPSQ